MAVTSLTNGQLLITGGDTDGWQQFIAADNVTQAGLATGGSGGDINNVAIADLRSALTGGIRFNQGEDNNRLNLTDFRTIQTAHYPIFGNASGVQTQTTQLPGTLLDITGSTLLIIGEAPQNLFGGILLVPVVGDQNSVIYFNPTDNFQTAFWSSSQAALNYTGRIVIDGNTSYDSHWGAHPNANLTGVSLEFLPTWTLSTTPNGFGLLPNGNATNQLTRSFADGASITSEVNPRFWYFTWPGNPPAGGANSGLAILRDYTYNVTESTSTTQAGFNIPGNAGEYVQTATIRSAFRRGAVTTTFYGGSIQITANKLHINPVTTRGNGFVPLDNPVSLNNIWYSTNGSQAGHNSVDLIASRYRRTFVDEAGSGINNTRFAIIRGITRYNGVNEPITSNYGTITSRIAAYGITDANGQITVQDESEITAPIPLGTSTVITRSDTDLDATSSLTINNRATNTFNHRVYEGNTKLIVTASSELSTGNSGGTGNNPASATQTTAGAAGNVAAVSTDYTEVIRIPGYEYQENSLTLPQEIIGNHTLITDARYNSTAAAGIVSNLLGTTTTTTVTNTDPRPVSDIYSSVALLHSSRNNVDANSVVPYTYVGTNGVAFTNDLTISLAGSTVLTGDSFINDISILMDLDGMFGFQGLTIRNVVNTPRSFPGATVPDDLDVDFSFENCTFNGNLILLEAGRTTVFRNCSGTVTVNSESSTTANYVVSGGTLAVTAGTNVNEIAEQFARTINTPAEDGYFGVIRVNADDTFTTIVPATLTNSTTPGTYTIAKGDTNNYRFYWKRANTPDTVNAGITTEGTGYFTTIINRSNDGLTSNTTETMVATPIFSALYSGDASLGQTTVDAPIDGSTAAFNMGMRILINNPNTNTGTTAGASQYAILSAADRPEYLTVLLTNGLTEDFLVPPSISSATVDARYGQLDTSVEGQQQRLIGTEFTNVGGFLPELFTNTVLGFSNNDSTITTRARYQLRNADGSFLPEQAVGQVFWPGGSSGPAFNGQFIRLIEPEGTETALGNEIVARVNTPGVTADTITGIIRSTNGVNTLAEFNFRGVRISGGTGGADRVIEIVLISRTDTAFGSQLTPTSV